MKCLVVLLAISALREIEGLTQDEIGQFKTTGITETNTGLVGTVSITTSGDILYVVSNGIPDHTTGAFPGTGNPNSIGEQSYNWTVPANPSLAASATCLPFGPIAFAKNGVPIFNAYNNENEDAIVNEVFDSCNGHPDTRSAYHYHQNPNCVVSGYNQFVGVAIDGFPIYGIEETPSTDLDECQGHSVGGSYRYQITDKFHYTLGCFSGTPLRLITDNCDYLTRAPEATTQAASASESATPTEAATPTAASGTTAAPPQTTVAPTSGGAKVSRRPGRTRKP